MIYLTRFLNTSYFFASGDFMFMKIFFTSILFKGTVMARVLILQIGGVENINLLHQFKILIF